MDIATSKDASPIRGADASRATLLDGTSFALDVIRALSAEAVVVGHGMSFFGVLPRLQPPRIPAIQEVGVAVFFVLSGFLICFTTATKRAKDPRYGFDAYFVDRFSRIYSGYIPALLFIAVFDGIWLRVSPESYPHHATFDVVTGAGNVFMLETFPPLVALHRLIPQIPAIDRLGTGRPLWSLAVEWWIYLFFGWAVLRGQLRKQTPVLFWSVLAFFSIVPLWNAVSGYGEGISVAWAFGAIGSAWLLRGIKPRSSKTWGWLCFASAVVAVGRAAFVHGRAWDGVFVALLAAAIVTGIFALQGCDFSVGAPVRRTVRFVADYSFMLYLTHYSILECLVSFKPRLGGVALLLIGLAVSNAVAAVIALPTEMRHRALSRYLHERLRAHA